MNEKDEQIWNNIMGIQKYTDTHIDYMYNAQLKLIMEKRINKKEIEMKSKSEIIKIIS